MGDNSRKRTFLQVLEESDENRQRGENRTDSTERPQQQNRPRAAVRGRALANRFTVVRPVCLPVAGTSSTTQAYAASKSSGSAPAGLLEEQLKNLASVVVEQVMAQLRSAHQSPLSTDASPSQTAQTSAQQPISCFRETTPRYQGRGVVQRALETPVTPVQNVNASRLQRINNRKNLFALYEPTPKKEHPSTFTRTIVAYDQQMVHKLSQSVEQDLEDIGFGRSIIEFDVNNSSVDNYLTVKQHPSFFGFHNYDGPLRMWVAKSHGRRSPLVALKWAFPQGRILKQISGIIYVMPDVKNEDGSENLNFVIEDLPVVRPQEGPIALPLGPTVDNDYIDRCSTCQELFPFSEIDSHQWENEGGLNEKQSLTCPDCGVEYVVGPGEKGHECSKNKDQGLEEDDTIPAVETEEEKRDYGIALMTSFTEGIMRATKEEAYREPDLHGNVFLPFKRNYWLDGFVTVVKDPAVLLRIRYPAVFSIADEPAIDSGGVTNEVVSFAIKSTAIELDLLMDFYEEERDSETTWRLKAAGLICAIGAIQCGFFEPIFYEWALKLKGQTAHPFIEGMNLLDFAKFVWENEPIGALFKSRKLTAKEFLAMLNRRTNRSPETELLEQCGMEHFASFLSSVEKGRVLMDDVDGSIKATVNDVYQFCTGSRIIPLDTLKSDREGSARCSIDVVFVTGRDPEVPVIPSAATCTPKITLPLTSKLKFKQSWQTALNHRIGFGNC